MAAKDIAAIDPRLADFIERGKRAQAIRREAPAVSVRGMPTIEQKELIAKFSKDSGGQDKEMHFMFGDRQKSDSYADSGYEPVVYQGHQVQCQGDPLWKIPMDLHKRSLQETVDRSNWMLGEKAKAEEDKLKANKTFAGRETETRRVNVGELAAEAARSSD